MKHPSRLTQDKITFLTIYSLSISSLAQDLIIFRVKGHTGAFKGPSEPDFGRPDEEDLAPQGPPSARGTPAPAPVAPRCFTEAEIAQFRSGVQAAAAAAVAAMPRAPRTSMPSDSSAAPSTSTDVPKESRAAAAAQKSAAVPPVPAPAAPTQSQLRFWDVFELHATVPLAQGTDALQADVCSMTSDGQYVLLASRSSTVQPPAPGAAPAPIPAFENTSFHLVRLRDGIQTCCTVLRDDHVQLCLGQGVSFHNEVLAVLGLLSRAVHVFQANLRTGQLVPVRKIGDHVCEDDELHLTELEVREARVQQDMQRVEHARSGAPESSFRRVLSRENLARDDAMECEDGNARGRGRAQVAAAGEAGPSSRACPLTRILCGISQRVVTKIFRDSLATRAPKAPAVTTPPSMGGLAPRPPSEHAGSLKGFYARFDKLADLVVWRVCVLDEHRLMLVLSSPDAGNRNTNELCTNSWKLAIYNMVTTRVEEVLTTGFIEDGGWLSLLNVLGPRQKNDSPWLCYQWDLNNSYRAREKFDLQLNKFPACSQKGRRILMCIMGRGSGMSPTPLMNPDLFNYEECLGIAVGKPRPFTPGEAPTLFAPRLPSSRRANARGFSIAAGSVEGLTTGAGGAGQAAGSVGGVKHAITHLFHPCLPLILTTLQNAQGEVSLAIAHRQCAAS